MKKDMRIFVEIAYPCWYTMRGSRLLQHCFPRQAEVSREPHSGSLRPSAVRTSTGRVHLRRCPPGSDPLFIDCKYRKTRYQMVSRFLWLMHIVSTKSYIRQVFVTPSICLLRVIFMRIPLEHIIEITVLLFPFSENLMCIQCVL